MTKADVFQEERDHFPKFCLAEVLYGIIFGFKSSLSLLLNDIVAVTEN